MQHAGHYFRFCPGEELIKLSDAVCRGRRRSNFPKCKGCQFNDEERPATDRFDGGADQACAAASNSVVFGALAAAERTDQQVGVAAPVGEQGTDIGIEAAAPEAASAPEWPIDAPVGVDEITVDDARLGAGALAGAFGLPAGQAPSAATTSAAAVPAASPAERLAEFHRLFRQSDVRGSYPAPLNAAAAWRIGHAAAQLLRSRLKGFQRADPRGRSLVVGRDARAASAALHAAMVDGVLATGATVLDLGVIDTPQLGFAVRHMGAGGGVVTTGGRSAAACSGFKFCGFAGRDVGWTTGLLDIRDVAGRIPMHRTGSLGGRYEVDVSAAYREFLLRLAPARLPRPLSVAIDACGGAAGPWWSRVFGGIENLRIVAIRDNPSESVERESDPTASSNLSALRQLVRAEKADLGVCFDGDADACVFLDERGAVVRTDVAIALLARCMIETHGPGLVVHDYRCGRVVGEELTRLEAAARPEAPESSAIRKAMVEGNAVFGGSMSGQFYFRECGMAESAFAATAVMIGLLASAPRRLSDRTRPLSRGQSSGERRLSSEDPADALERVAGEYRQLAQRLLVGLSVRGDDWGFHLYRRGGESSLSLWAEAPTRERLASVVREVQSLVTASERA